MTVRGAAFGLALAVLSASARHEPANDTYARGASGAVVAEEPTAARAGLAVLRAGGNAVGAAVATALVLAVTHPQAGNLGGGGFMIVAMADGRTAAIDYRERAPARAHRDMYLRADGSVDVDLSRRGALAGGVPGSPAGLVRALELFGSRPLEDLAAPAIALAEEGFEVGHYLADSLREASAALSRFPSSRAVFTADGVPLRAGQRLVQRDLAATLRRFAAGGFDGFYRGDTADHIVAAMERGGGAVTREDLAGYEVSVRDALRGSYRGYEVLSMPPPSSGGVALLQMLNLLEPYDLAGEGFGSAKTIHLMSEAMRRAYADRARWLGDSDHYAVPVEGLIAKSYADTLRQSMRTDRVTTVEPGLPPGAKSGGNTTHFSIVDAAGNAVACTTTINSSFGSGLVIDGAGFLWNNEMDDFSAKPGVPNQFGLVGGKANAIAPGKRPLSSMTPTIVRHDGKVRWVLGSPGGGRIINTVLQVLLNVADHGMPLREAVAAPRVHHQWKPASLAWEHTALNPDSRRLLEKLGHAFDGAPSGIGRCQALEITPEGVRVGAADPRTGGAAVAY